MKIFDLRNGRETDNIGAPLCMILGNFDGVHEGHASLIRLAVAEGKKRGLKTAAWTFADHPLAALSDKTPRCLTDAGEKNGLFAAAGLDYAVYEDFSSVRGYSPAEFVEKILTERFDCRTAVCGFNFKFGKNGVGNPTLLRRLMEDAGRSVIVADAVYKLGSVVSSTAIRAMIENGDTESAAVMLGRPYSVTLPVVHGKMLGRTIGIPTVNQRFPEGRIVPRQGIYAVICLAEGKRYVGVANVGTRPTVNADSSDVNCETHIIGYSGDLYGSEVTVSFYKRLRDEKKFSGLQELKGAVEKDIGDALKYFSKDVLQ